ncbi:MAG: PDZ domain-containing protein [Lysobacter sp.]|nr:PDZ domain-containing protein [Lysobacter sp.]
MTLNRTAKTAAAVILLAIASTALAAKGKLGFATEASTSGFISPVLESLKVTIVRPKSPAAAAGLRSGDYITAVNDRLTAGADAREMADQFKSIEIGQKIRLKVKRGNVFADIEIIAGQ